MEPKEACVKASAMALAGDLQGAVDILEPILEEYREFGPAYTLHAKVFLMAGDAAQPIIDLDAAEWANREYGTSDDILAVTELRAVTYAVRTIYAGKNEIGDCREQIELLMRERANPESWWFLPAACYEQNYKEKEARDWIEKLLNYSSLKSAAGFFFKKSGGLTQLLAMPKDPKEMIPVHYARHYRAKRDGDLKGAEKYRKRMSELIGPESLWRIIDLYASGAVVVAAV
ncbi:MAG: hypothetical protein KDB29_11250 [Planctomycetes bacterium]|nr:hypothetical protein [Planctomycetota bacterium]